MKSLITPIEGDVSSVEREFPSFDCRSLDVSTEDDMSLDCASIGFVD